jgi:hypothetical protein
MRLYATADRRFQTVALTAKGRGPAPRLSAIADANDHEFLGHLNRATRGAIDAAMQEIVGKRYLRAALSIEVRHREFV